MRPTARNEAGRSDVVVNDWLGSDGKWRNLQKRQIADLVPPAELMKWLQGRKLEAVIHMGAISDTTATDGDLDPFERLLEAARRWRVASLERQRGSQVIQGHLMVIPIEESLIYVQPIYLESGNAQLPEFERVVRPETMLAPSAELSGMTRRIVLMSFSPNQIFCTDTSRPA